MDLSESQNQRDARVEQLWRKLDFQNKGELDWRGLQKGLKRIDHPMKNAERMMKDIVQAVDSNGDGKIQYEEFRVFVEAAERQLMALFRAIDRDHNGMLDQDELQLAFQRAGISIPLRRLSGFFQDIDHNHDGYITYEEWRDFLLFMPNNIEPNTTLRAIFSFYSEILTLNSEGDSVVSGDTLQSIGTATAFLLNALFGSVTRIALPYGQPPSSNQATQSTSETKSASSTSHAPSTSSADMEAAASHTVGNASGTLHEAATAALEAATATTSPTAAIDTDEHGTGTTAGCEKPKKSVLIRFLPDPGYFVAGAVAGGISRTATAPLDRLKVYLLVNTKTDSAVSIHSIKSGRPLAVLKNAGRPLINAMADLYKSGGMRGFFAGNGLNVVKIMPETAIRFGAYEAAKKTLASFEGHGDSHHINPYSKFVAGGVAGMVAQFCVYPLDTLKFRLQSDYVQGGPRGNKLLLLTCRKMISEGGARAAYRGVTMGLIGMFPYSAIDMGTFEFLKTTYVAYRAKKLGVHEEDAQPSTFATGIMGASSGAFGATVVYPLNVLRTRLQTQGTEMHPARYTGIWDVAHTTIRNEGVRGLYKGLMPNLLKVAPALSITWMVYEKTKSVMSLH